MTLRDRNTVKQVAEHWGCSPSHIHNLIASGTLAALRLGGMLRITREQVTTCEAACETKVQLDQEKVRVEALERSLAVDRALATARRQCVGRNSQKRASQGDA